MAEPSPSIDELLEQADQHRNAGRLAEAEALYRAIVQLYPGHTAATRGLGSLALQGQRAATATSGPATADASDADAPSSVEIRQTLSLFDSGRHADVVPVATALTRRFPRHGFGWQALAMALRLLGRNAEALAPMQMTATLLAEDPEAHFNLGATLMDLGQPAAAEASFQRALESNSGHRQALFALGALLHAQGRLAEAEVIYRRAVDLEPGFAATHDCLGRVLGEQGRLAEAEGEFRRAIEIDPGLAESRYNLGIALTQRDRRTEAEASYRQALALRPDYAEAYNNLGGLLREQGRLGEAEACYRQTLAIRTDFAEAHANLGNVLAQAGRPDEAEASYRQALATRPDYAEAACDLAAALHDLGRQAEAEACYKQALAIRPDLANARLALAMMALPAFPQTADDARAAPAHFDLALHDLSEWLDADPGHRASLAEALGSQQPFYLAYRDGNHAGLLSRYGDIVAAAITPPPPPPLPERDKVRLLIVSHHLHRHSVWDIIVRGLLTHLDRSRFEVVLYHLGHEQDEETARARSLADVWRDLRDVSSLPGWLDAVAVDRPDVIFYPEIGMDPMSLRLAARRLAPLQAAGWGHPITTGLPTIDLFFSGDMLEPADGESHYRERLVRLPGTGCCTTPIAVQPAPTPELETELSGHPGIRFVIAQMAFKFDPADDALYARIAAAVGDCVFILLDHPKAPEATGHIVARLGQAFRAIGLDPAQHLRIIPWLPREKFLGLLSLCDIYLDCPSFSGYTTAWQAVHRSLPVVTLAGNTLRQRLAAGLLRRIEASDTIATTADEYVAIATRLADECRDPRRRDARRSALAKAAARADDDRGVVRAFESSVLDALADRGRYFRPAPRSRPGNAQ